MIRFSFWKDHSGYRGSHKLTSESRWQIRAATKWGQVCETPRKRKNGAERKGRRVRWRETQQSMSPATQQQWNQRGACQKCSLKPHLPPVFNKVPRQFGYTFKFRKDSSSVKWGLVFADHQLYHQSLAFSNLALNTVCNEVAKPKFLS